MSQSAIGTTEFGDHKNKIKLADKNCCFTECQTVIKRFACMKKVSRNFFRPLKIKTILFFF